MGWHNHVPSHAGAHMKFLFYIFALIAIYYGLGAINDLLHLRLFSLLWDGSLAALFGYSAYKLRD